VVVACAAAIGVLGARAPAIAIGAVILALIAWMPAWLLLVGAIASARGFDVVLSRSGLVSWQTASVFLAGAAVAKWMLAPKTRSARPSSATTLLIVAFMIWLLITSIATGTVLTAPLQLAPFAILPIVYSTDAGSEERLLRAIVWLALLELIVSISQRQTRLVGVHVNDPHQMGFLLIAALAIVLGRSITIRNRHYVIAALVLGILATRTRGVWLSAIVLLALWVVPRLTGARVFAVIGGFVLMGALLFTPATKAFDLNPHSAQLRNDSVSEGLKVATHHPLFGVGWTSASVQRGRGAVRPLGDRPYDVFVFLAVVGGFPAAVLFGALLVHGLRLSTRRHFGALLLFGAFMSFSVSEMTLYPGSLTAPLFFVFLAIAANASRTHEPIAQPHAET
jgi:hypothetical protein